MMKQYAKLGLILAAFAVAACVGLSFVYAATKDQIAVNQDKQLNESLKSLFPTAAEFKDITGEVKPADGQTKLVSVYVATGSGANLGVALKATGPSYGGPVTVLVGLGIDRRIAGIRILASSDTPGLGLNATNPNYYVKKAEKITFSGQFTDKPITDAFVVKQDVDAITASTITSKAITAIVKASVDSGEAWLERTALGGN
jgi:electron transport complex protein RnfG